MILPVLIGGFLERMTNARLPDGVPLCKIVSVITLPRGVLLMNTP